MENQLKRIIDLIRRTGDRVVVYDSNNPENSHVVMSFSEYEKMTALNDKKDDLTERELIDNINGDIAMWKNENGVFSNEAKEEEEIEENLYYYQEKDNHYSNNGSLTDTEKEEVKKGGWSISNDMKEKAEEIN